MITVFAGDDLGGDAGVVLVALDDPVRGIMSKYQKAVIQPGVIAETPA